MPRVNLLGRNRRKIGIGSVSLSDNYRTQTSLSLPGDLQRSGHKTLVLEVPLDLPITYLAKRFREIVSNHHGSKKGVRSNQKSQAKYRVTGKVDKDFLPTALAVWGARQAEPTKPLWKIANDLRLVKAAKLIKASEIDKPDRDKVNVLAATASRYLKNANAMIEKR